MSIEFTKSLIKGRIAETVFEQMIRDEGQYTVIPFGYEHAVPTLSQYREHTMIQRVMDNISDAPDFALVSNDKTKVFLVEVKYRSTLDANELRDAAKGLMKRWDPSWLFVATPQGFFCSPSSSVAKEGLISPLSESWIPVKRREEYLKLLNQFEK